jgi:hypothetical protein
MLEGPGALSSDMIEYPLMSTSYTALASNKSSCPNLHVHILISANESVSTNCSLQPTQIPRQQPQLSRLRKFFCCIVAQRSGILYIYIYIYIYIDIDLK